jgi:hypothetical protein
MAHANHCTWWLNSPHLTVLLDSETFFNICNISSLLFIGIPIEEK